MNRRVVTLACGCWLIRMMINVCATCESAMRDSPDGPWCPKCLEIRRNAR